MSAELASVPAASTSHTLSTPEFELHYDLHGDIASPHKVLFIMGLLTDGAAWEHQVNYFKANGYQCVTYDNRGVAASGTPGFAQLHTYTTRNMAHDAHLLVDHLGWESFHVVGVSMGGMIALEFALAVPASRILSLSLMVTHAGGWSGLAPLSGVKSMVKNIFARSDVARLDTLMRMMYSEATINNPNLGPKLRAHHVERMATRVPPKMAAVFGHTLAVYRHYVSYARLLRIRYSPFPTLVVVGEEDQLVRIGNSHMLANVLGARLFVVEDGAHGLLAAYAGTVNKELLGHFEAAQQQRDGLRARPDHSPSDPDAAGATEGDFAVESQEALLGDDQPAYSLESQAVSLACAHTVHCSFHHLTGFLSGFAPAFLFRWIFFDSIAMHAVPPISRLEQSIRFGLLVGMTRAAYRAVACIAHTYRARQWVRKHRLTVHANTTAAVDAADADEQTKKGIPASQYTAVARSRSSHRVTVGCFAHSCPPVLPAPVSRRLRLPPPLFPPPRRLCLRLLEEAAAAADRISRRVATGSHWTSVVASAHSPHSALCTPALTRASHHLPHTRSKSVLFCDRMCIDMWPRNFSYSLLQFLLSRTGSRSRRHSSKH